MKIAIVSAMEDEIKFLLKNFSSSEKKIIYNYEFYTTSYKNLDLVIARSGIGKTSAGMLISMLVSNFSVDKIINTGICGGRLNHSNIGDIIVMDKAFYGDFDVHIFGDCEYGQVPLYPPYFKSDPLLFDIADNCLKGDFLTNDRFVTSKEEMENLISNYFSRYNVLGFDMESAAFAQAAYYFNIGFIAIRATSDVVGHTSTNDYQNNEINLCKLSSEYLLDFIKKLVLFYDNN